MCIIVQVLKNICSYVVLFNMSSINFFSMISHGIYIFSHFCRASVLTAPAAFFPAFFHTRKRLYLNWKDIPIYTAPHLEIWSSQFW